MEQNQLAKYIGKDLKGSVANIQVVQGTAKDSGNIYYCLEITLINGYKYRKFMRGGEDFAWLNAFEQLDAQVQVNAAF